MPHFERRKELGRFYTPDWLATVMAREVFTHHPTPLQARILDPACGDGALILAVVSVFASRMPTLSSVERLQWVEHHLYGVDIVSAPLERLRLRLAEWIGSDVDPARVEAALNRNFVCGDALSGPVGSGPTTRSTGIHWAETFPEVLGQGGFDIIIANPPYRRERNFKSLVDGLRSTELGAWATPRADLWHLFLHRSLDLLAPGGILEFLVSSYWVRSHFAARMRERMRQETTCEALTFLGSARVFADVAGQHMTFRLRKGVSQSPCLVTQCDGMTAEQIREFLDLPIRSGRSITQADLWSGARLRVDDRKTLTAPCRLEQWFDVRQGIAENPPFVTRTAAQELGQPDWSGRGVFVLTDDEVRGLNLCPREQALLRPYFALTAVHRFQISEQPTHQILYLTSRTAPDIDELPNVRAHLLPFRTLLERRREVASGRIGWWHLHWPRQEHLFLEPRIIGLQMGVEPTFAFTTRPAFVGFSANVIVARTGTGEYGRSTERLSLAALCAILNSSRARVWFEAHAKHRGARLDLSGAILRQFPIPETLSPGLRHGLESWTARPGADSLELEALVQAAYLLQD